MRIKFIQIKEGQTVASVRNGEQFTVMLVDHTQNFAELKDSKGKFRKASKSTLERWYKLIEIDEPVVEEPVATDQHTEQLIDNVPTIEEVADIQLVVVDEEVHVPVQPSKPKTSSSPGRRPVQVDGVIQNIRIKLIEECAKLPNVNVNETQSYTKLSVGKLNFAEIYTGKRSFTVRVLSKALGEVALGRCTVAPPTYGWTIDCSYRILTEQDFDFALMLLKESCKYRLQNPPTRSK